MKRSDMLLSVLMVSLLVIVTACAGTTKIYQPQGQITTPATAPAAAPATAPSAAPAQTAAPELAATMPQDSKCESGYGIGWVPSSCTFDGTTFKVTLKAVGQNGIGGIAFYLEGATGNQKILTDSTKASYGQNQEYSFSVADIESQIGNVEKITAMPIKNSGGTDYACFNQRLLIISNEACRAS